MTIPALFVVELVGERTQRAKEVTDEISGLVGVSKPFLDPRWSFLTGCPSRLSASYRSKF